LRRKILASLARRAYRRPVSAGDLAPLIALYRQGARDGGFESGVKLALRRLLVSPGFIFRANSSAERRRRKLFTVSATPSLLPPVVFPVEQHSRRRAAHACGDKRLSEPSVLRQQVQRMLADPRSQALVKNFSGQWRSCATSRGYCLIPRRFRISTRTCGCTGPETELLIDSTLREDRSIADLLTTNYTFAISAWLSTTGMKGIYGSEFRAWRCRTRTPGSAGTGQHLDGDLLSQPDRAHDPRKVGAGATLVLRATTTTQRPSERGCQHKKLTCVNAWNCTDPIHLRGLPPQMDPIGFSLENFDGLGRWRDATAPDGTDRFSGVLPTAQVDVRGPA